MQQASTLRSAMRKTLGIASVEAIAFSFLGKNALDAKVQKFRNFLRSFETFWKVSKLFRNQICQRSGAPCGMVKVLAIAYVR